MDSDLSSLRAIRELICSCFKRTYIRYFCSTYIRGTLREQSLSLTRNMKPWILLPVTLEWLKDWTFHTSMGRKWCHCNANFPQGINSHLTIQSWCRHTDLACHPCWFLFHLCMLLVNIDYWTTLCERCCGYRVQPPHTHTVSLNPHARWRVVHLKLGPLPFPFVHWAILVSLWKGGSIARRSCFFWTVKTRIYEPHGALITSYIRVYLYVSHSSYRWSVSFINTEIVCIHSLYPFQHLDCTIGN